MASLRYGRSTRGRFGPTVMVIMVVALICRTPGVSADAAANYTCAVPDNCNYDDWKGTLECSNSSCNAIPSEAMGDRNFVKWLDLSHNLIENISEINDYKDLKHLDLNHNLIGNVPALGLDNLAFLDLSWNWISAMNDSVFQGCTGLEKVNLTGNRLASVSSRLFHGLKYLTVIRLDNNRLTEIAPDAFYYTNGLTSLNISYNMLSNLSRGAIRDLESLRVLNLDHNRLSTIHGHDFEGLSGLQYLYLQGNKITEIERNTFFDNDDLLTLDLSDNSLTLLERATFIGLTHIRSLHLSGNQIVYLDDGLFSGLFTLEYINLGRNPLLNISQEVFPSEILSISIERCPSLETIANKTFQGLRDLRSIYIRNNTRLWKIEAGAFDMEHSTVSTVDFSNNHLVSIDEKLLNWPELTYLDLSGNKWDCDCHLNWLSEAKLSGMITKQHQPKCATPYRVQGQFVDEVDPEEFSCTFFSRYRHNMGIALIVLTTFVFVVGGSCIIYKYRYRVFPWRYKSPNKYESLFTDGEDDENPNSTVRWETANDETSALTGTNSSNRPAPTQV